MTDTKSNKTTEDNESIILNSKLADSTSKIIFENSILCSQFLRNYIDLPYLKNVQPEDIEDVSDQYVPLFSEERNSDRVKKVHIRNDKPFFLVSLIEHKSGIDYNVSMQIFRYMVYIWETYAKEAEKIQKDITKRADFKYPPILPIVYYEGSKRWTVPLDFKSKIIEGEAFGKYLPDFEYYLVPLRKYSNEELLAKKDEISLVMLINRMQNEEDVEEFRNLSASEVESILQNTPEHLLDIISNILRTFLLKMKFSETETEELVGKVKEKKMGVLFENVVPFDIEKARRKAEEAERQANIRIANAEARAIQAEQNADAKVALAEQNADAKVALAEQNADAKVDNLIRAFIELCQDMNLSKEEVVQKLLSKYEMNETSALAKLNSYWKS